MTNSTSATRWTLLKEQLGEYPLSAEYHFRTEIIKGIVEHNKRKGLIGFIKYKILKFKANR